MGGSSSKIVSINKKYNSVLDIGPINTIDGVEQVSLNNILEGKKCFLIVNVASKRGITHVNYAQLVEIHQEYKDRGFEIIGFPCNQFGK